MKMKSKPRHPKYKIKEGDTIQSVTERFGVEENIWKRYHSNMCCLDDIIRENMPPHLTEIFLLPELWDKEDALNTMLSKTEELEKKINQHVEFGYQNTLPMRFCSKKLYYGVIKTIKSQEKVNTVKYGISVRWMKREEQMYFIEIDKISDTYINDLLPDLMADRLAVQVSSALYPIELIVSREDGIIDIGNFSTIQERWAKIKPKIKDYYSGETLDKYLRLNDKVISNKDTLLRSLQNDWLLHAYFNKIYQTYGSHYSCSNVITAPLVFDTQGVEYTVKQTIDELVDKDGIINIHMEGTVTDERSSIDLENKLDSARYESDVPVTGNYSAHYLMEPKYHTIDRLTLNCSLDLENRKEISVVVTQIQK